MDPDAQHDLRNLASNVPLTRLGALERIRMAALADLDELFDAALLEQVREARARGASWEDVGDALGISHTHAGRRFRDRL